jgi:hypothetical protein
LAPLAVLFLNRQLATSSQVEVDTANNGCKDHDANDNASSDNGWIASTSAGVV